MRTTPKRKFNITFTSGLIQQLIHLSDNEDECCDQDGHGPPQASQEASFPSGAYASSTGSQAPIRKRKRSDQDNDRDGDQYERPDRHKEPPHANNDDMNVLRFACPYRKGNPRTYNVATWKSCALTPLASIARVK